MIQRMDGLDTRFDRLETKMDEGFAALGNKIDQALFRQSVKAA